MADGRAPWSVEWGGQRERGHRGRAGDSHRDDQRVPRRRGLSCGAAGAARRAHGRRPADAVAQVDRGRHHRRAARPGRGPRGRRHRVRPARRVRAAGPSGGRPMHIVAADDRTRRLLRRARLHSLLTARRPRSPANRRSPAPPADPLAAEARPRRAPGTRDA